MSLKLLRMIMTNMPDTGNGCSVSEAREMLHLYRNGQRVLTMFALIQQNAVEANLSRY